MATSRDKREELARGAGLLTFLGSEFPQLDIQQAASNRFNVFKDDKYYGNFEWRLFNDGFGTVIWYPSPEFIDVAHFRKMPKYNYTDGKTDIIMLVAFVGEILEDLGL